MSELEWTKVEGERFVAPRIGKYQMRSTDDGGLEYRYLGPSPFEQVEVYFNAEFPISKEPENMQWVYLPRDEEP